MPFSQRHYVGLINQGKSWVCSHHTGILAQPSRTVAEKAEITFYSDLSTLLRAK